jgi:small-conductance mechanosensitive channel
VYREILTFFAFIGISTIFWVANQAYPHPYLQKLFLIAAVLTALYLVFQVVLIRIVTSRVGDEKTRYTLNRVFNILSLVIFVAASVTILLDDPTSLLVTYSIIGAGIAFALQDVFKNFVGSIIIITGSLYRIGDRIEIDGRIGDVMDVGIMNTTLMEIRGWVEGDQTTGRLTLVPNGFVINHTIENYTKDHSFIWDEVFIPITYDSDWRHAITLLTGIMEEETKTIVEQADKEIKKLGEKYYLARKVTTPAVYMNITDNWIALDARYVTDARNRRTIKNRITQRIMEAIETSGTIRISSTTQTVTVVPGSVLPEQPEKS